MRGPGGGDVRRQGRGGGGRGAASSSAPLHPYTAGLLKSIPRVGQRPAPQRAAPGHPGLVPDLLAPAAGLRLSPALPARDRRSAGARSPGSNWRRRRPPGRAAGCTRSREPMNQTICSTSTDLKKYFPIKGGFFQEPSGTVHAVDGVSFRLARARPWAGGRERVRQIDHRAADPAPHPSPRRARSASTAGTSSGSTAARCSAVRRDMQMIFQDPYASLNPRMTVGEHRRRGVHDPRRGLGQGDRGPRRPSC